jgi:eukaryotic-like serine/threonine-protein kinase
MSSFADDPRHQTRQAPVTAATFAKGEILAGKYRIEKILGRGGMGHVFAAKHVALGQLVAVKVMHKDMLADADAVMRFGREAQAAAMLKGIHSARIFDVGTLDSGQPYMVMEHLEGQDLAAIVDSGRPVAIADALEWIAQACEAIAEAHDLGIVHRDIKPHNLFLTRDPSGRPVVKVLDFGLAKAIAPEGGGMKETRTPGQMALGSPFYMSPEQARGMRADHRTDIWSLAATLYTIIAGVPPFNGPSSAMTCAMLITEEPRPLSTLRPDATPALDDLLRRCMTKDREHRLASAREMLGALRALQAPRGSQPSQPSWNNLPKDTVRMASAPSWNNVPVAGPPSSHKGTVPLSQPTPRGMTPTARTQQPSGAIWWAIPIVLVVATIAIAAAAFFLSR